MKLRIISLAQNQAADLLGEGARLLTVGYTGHSRLLNREGSMQGPQLSGVTPRAGTLCLQGRTSPLTPDFRSLTQRLWKISMLKKQSIQQGLLCLGP